ncbi:MAG: hypothetical protein WBA28_07010 [Microbacteriaceae bacterium]
MNKAIILRSTFGIWISIISWVIAVGVVISFFYAPDSSQLILYIWPIALVCLLVWVMFWRPKLIIDEELIQVINPLTEYRLNFSAVNRIDTKYTLTLFTAEHKITVWSAPAPSRYAILRMAKVEGQHLPESSYVANSIRPGDLPSSESGSAAIIVRRIWESKRDNNLLTETPQVAIRYNWYWVLAAAVLLLATVIAPLF